MSLSLSFNTLSLRWNHAPHSLVEGMAATSEMAFVGLDAEDAADFMAQISEETGGGTAIEENLNYTASRLCQVWPSKFPTLASAMPYQHNPRALADHVYGGRYGNRPGTDDGYTYRGRGAIQLTFAATYERIGAAANLPIISNPDLVNDPRHFLDVAVAYWKAAGAPALADSGNFRGETLRINGGLTNFQTRLDWRKIWRAEFGLH